MPVWMHSSVKRLDYSVYSFIQKVIIMKILCREIARSKKEWTENANIE